MFKFKNREKANKVKKVISMIPNISDDKLKHWFELSDSNIQLRNPDDEDKKLYKELELELNKRGYKFVS